MRFKLSDSPFMNFSKYDSENIFDFLLPIAKNYCSTQHQDTNTPIPPSAFVLRGDEGEYYNGYGFRAPEDFVAELSLEANQADAIVIMAEVGSISQDFSRGLIVLSIQTRKYFRCRAFSLLTGEGFDILDDPPRIELPRKEGEEDEGVCHLLGLEALLQGLF